MSDTSVNKQPITCAHINKLESHGPLARYENLRVAHAPGMPGMFSPSRHARAVMHVGIAY